MGPQPEPVGALRPYLLQHLHCVLTCPSYNTQARCMVASYHARHAWPAPTFRRLPAGGAAPGRQGCQAVGGTRGPPGRAVVGRYLGCALCAAWLAASCAREEGAMRGVGTGDAYGTLDRGAGQVGQVGRLPRAAHPEQQQTVPRCHAPCNLVSCPLPPPLSLRPSPRHYRPPPPPPSSNALLQGEDHERTSPRLQVTYPSPPPTADGVLVPRLHRCRQGQDWQRTRRWRSGECRQQQGQVRCAAAADALRVRRTCPRICKPGRGGGQVHVASTAQCTIGLMAQCETALRPHAISMVYCTRCICSSTVCVGAQGGTVNAAGLLLLRCLDFPMDH